MADAADLKSASFGNVGSNPTTPTKWQFVDALLAEAEQENKAITFLPEQVSTLRQMIAEKGLTYELQST